jgi:hypothetical protein
LCIFVFAGAFALTAAFFVALALALDDALALLGAALALALALDAALALLGAALALALALDAALALLGAALALALDGVALPLDDALALLAMISYFSAFWDPRLVLPCGRYPAAALLVLSLFLPSSSAPS